MKKRSPLAVLLLGLVTFGLYDLYWLVKTKEVLNKRTKVHTPTIWLLVVPWVLIIVGYILIFVGATLTVVHSDTSNSAPIVAYSSTSSGDAAKSSVKSNTTGGEELNQKGQRRPAQYNQVCTTTGGLEYVTQGSPACLNGDQHTSDYSANVAGTVYSSPCKTTANPVRYVYVAVSEQCPEGTSLVFYNTSLGADTSSNSTNQDATVTTSSPSTANAYSSSSSSGPTSPVYVIGIIVTIIAFILYFITSIYWFFKFSKAINEYTSGKMSTAVSFLILYLIHLIGVALIQDTFNDMEDEPASATAAFTMTPAAQPGTPGAMSAAPMPPQPHVPPAPLAPTSPAHPVEPPVSPVSPPHPQNHVPSHSYSSAQGSHSQEPTAPHRGPTASTPTISTSHGSVISPTHNESISAIDSGAPRSPHRELQIKPLENDDKSSPTDDSASGHVG